jgi:hypothetical protein
MTLDVRKGFLRGCTQATCLGVLRFQPWQVLTELIFIFKAVKTKEVPGIVQNTELWPSFSAAAFRKGKYAGSSCSRLFL